MSCCECGGTVPPGTQVIPTSPIEVVPEADIIAAWDAAINVNTAGAVSLLPDITGNGFHLSQAVGANQPTLNLAGAPNSNPSILFDGVNDYMLNAALNIPAPGTTPLTAWGVFRQVAWDDARFFTFGSGGTSVTLFQFGVSPAIVQFAGTSVNSNTALVVGVYSIVETLFTNTTGDFIEAAGVRTTGANAGNNNPAAGLTMGANGTLTAFANAEYAELWFFRVALTALQRQQLRAYATAKYGPIP